MPKWKKFFDESEVGTVDSSPDDIRRIREAIPELVSAPAIKIDKAWEFFSSDQYDASHLVVTDQFLEHFREWLELDES